MSRFADYVSRLVASVSGPNGRTDPGLRAAVRLRVRSLVAGETPPDTPELPADLARYVDTVARHAFKVTDGQVEHLKTAGYSEDEIFDVTVSAAVSAGVTRLERGLAILRENR